MAKKNKPDKTSDRMARFLGKIDFKMFKGQKTKLLNIQAKMEKPNPKFSQRELNAIEGMINLCDSIQDVAIDEYGYDKHKLLNLSNKEE